MQLSITSWQVANKIPEILRRCEINKMKNKINKMELDGCVDKWEKRRLMCGCV
jgi:hypothetical protein